LSKGSITAEEISNLAEMHGIKKRTVFRRVQVNNRGKFAKIGRELDAIAKKRKVKKRDIAKLAKQLGVDTASIEARIESETKKKFAEIDRYLKVRTTKEYITDEEISGLAKLFHLPESEILKLVKCPIRKKSEIGTDKISPLDKTIEAVIEENLKIVGKSSLYDFLGLWIGSSLESLQKRTGEIEAEIRKIGQKNVFVTAAGILVGHCISIFKTAESRNAYDLSKARSRLKELNGDIEVAGMTGMVRSEYMKVLIRQAVAFGVDPDEASAHILGYCDRQGWKVEPPAVEKNGEPKNYPKPWIAAAGIALAIVAAALFYFVKSVLLEHEYEKLLAKSDRQVQLEDKRDLLAGYRETHPNSKHAQDLDQRIAALERQIPERDYRKAKETAEALIEKGRFEAAEKACDVFLDAHPDSPYAGEIEALKANIPLLLEAHRFKALSDLPSQAYEERIRAYSAYLADFPEGTRREKVVELFLAMQPAFFTHIKARLADCDRRRDWDPCLRLFDKFIQLYSGTDQAEELASLKTELLRREQEARELASLNARARMAGSDLEAARQVYIQYLAEHPDVSTRGTIEAAIAALNEKEKKILLASTDGRFVERRPGVVTDSVTGLMWALNQAGSEPPGCQDYDSALRYVNGLSTGGYNDWRLPAPEELRGIFKKKPFFPFCDGPWLWSSTSYKRYADGWFRVVEVVTAERDTQWTETARHEKECGTVLAVRP
jgi:tetratricopeptide (TPR) repeat protein